MSTANLDSAVSLIGSSMGSSYKILNYTEDKTGHEDTSNYTSTIHRVSITRKSIDKPEETSVLPVVLKIVISDPIHTPLIEKLAAFPKEATMYSQVFPKIIQFQKNLGIEESKIFKPFPSFYVANDKLVAVEDLNTRGYSMMNRTGEQLQFDDAAGILKTLAKFHALTWAMYGGKFEKILEDFPTLRERFYEKPEPLADFAKEWFALKTKQITDILKERGELELAGVLEMLVENYWVDMHHLSVTPSSPCVIIHGDCWNGNFFIHPESREVKFIDFQCSSPARRGIDLAYFFYLSLPIDVLNHRETELLGIYHTAFVAACTGFKASTPTDSFHEFHNEFKNCRKYGIVRGILGIYYLIDRIPPDVFEKMCYTNLVNILRQHVPLLNVV